MSRPAPVRKHHLSSVIPVLVLLIPACAARSERGFDLPPAEIETIPAERLLDARLAGFLGSPRERAALTRSSDRLSRLDAFWERRDPTRGTPENETLAVYRQRGSYLERRFPDTPFGEMSPGWQVFLRYGQPDLQGNRDQPWRAHDPRHLGLLQVTPSSGAEERFYRYSTPRSFTAITQARGVLRYTGSYPPVRPPDLGRAWEHLEDPGSSLRRRWQALDVIAWYELPGVVARLLSVPTAQFAGLEEKRAETLTRLALRSGYTLPVEDARRLAALRAAGGSPDYLLFRARSGHYTVNELKEDLTRLELALEEHRHLERTPERGPNVELWIHSETLLARLANLYSSEETVTGWDWQGDLVLSCGQPSSLIPGTRLAYYTWGTPEVIGVVGSGFGTIESMRVQDTLGDFIAMALEEVEKRRREGDEAARTLAAGLRSDEEGERQSMLEHLHTLAPAPIYQVGLPPDVAVLPLTMDAVAFPAGPDSIEVQASFGTPAEAVNIATDRRQYTSNLRTSFVLLNARMQVVHADVRRRGYVVEGTPDRAGQFVLDTFRFTTAPGFYIAYLSVVDPTTGRTGGILQSLDFEWQNSPGVQVSPIMIATDITPAGGEGKFVRNGLRILPSPSRHLYYGTDLHFYYEIGNLTRSEFGDYAWNESYYVIPSNPAAGIIQVSLQQDFTRLTPGAIRQMAIDLSRHEGSYTGSLVLVAVVTDLVGNHQGVGVTRFTLHSRTDDPPR